MPGDGATIPAPARPYYPGVPYQSAPSRAPSRQGRLLPIHPSTATVNRAEQYWVERQAGAVAGNFGRPPQTADASSRSRMSRGQQLLYSRGSSPSAPLLLPRSKSNFSLSGSSMTGGAALDVPTTRRREARRGPEAQHRLEVQHRLERHNQQRGDGYTSIGCLQARRSHSRPTTTTTFTLALTSLTSLTHRSHLSPLWPLSLTSPTPVISPLSPLSSPAPGGGSGDRTAQQDRRAGSVIFDCHASERASKK